MNYIAHIRDIDKKEQSVKHHLLDSKSIAENLGEKLDLKYLSGLAALLHDFGKASPEFDDYIYTAVYNPENAKARGSVDHSTAGGKLLFDLFHNPQNNEYEQLLAEIVGNAIISHHNYLQNFISPDLELPYLNRVANKPIDYYEEMKDYFFSEVMSKKEFHRYVSEAMNELERFLKRIDETDFYSGEPLEMPLLFLTKVIFSILIDADRTNTRLFEENIQEEVPSDTNILFERYFEKLQVKLTELQSKSDSTKINQLRQEMSQQCEEFAAKKTGIYTLSIPTGGGKTLASFRYALKHALLHQKKRIIYVVPFTTIIEQNAKEIRDIIDDDSHLLEHHSNVSFLTEEEINESDFDETKRIQKKLLLAKDNWDSPIIFTSMVQFLNVFYAKGTRNIRRLHNLSDAIIIFDEAQKIPTKCVSLFNEALNFLNSFMNTTSILCTATQPTLKDVSHKLNLIGEVEIIKNLDDVLESFKRVEIKDCATNHSITTNQLAEMVIEHDELYRSQLIILNTKTVVKKLYLAIKDQLPDTAVYHLSTSMCPKHRMEILEEIRTKLANKEKIICISTQLIEAGVDVSFESVIRSLTGLDSIAQAAGRCNRHGEHEIGDVYLIDHQEEVLTRLEEIDEGKAITKKMLVDIRNDPKTYQGDLLSTTAMNFYFRTFYNKFCVTLDYVFKKETYTHVDLLFTNFFDNRFVSEYQSKFGKNYSLFFSSSMSTSAKNFEVISNMTKSVIVPYGYGKEIIAELNSYRSVEDFSKLMKTAQLYTINLYNYEFNLLEKQKAILPYLGDSVYVLVDNYYSKEHGLSLQGDVEMEFLEFLA
ncbi:CRISPR-associated helicase Cas3' [Enterococcus saccharolyticus]|uniref:CRISPR-associated helicase Cas3' n=1 Tax=Enterococcus TaxID=1350 RepID=UPI001E345B4D|nr:CRISPR-associated helicase Cas3' [Enterococcus saccharolyticus]MCD5001105.1 CRISPR-associated helicase Cas3' [Enterococcus saccharolyticus]